MALGAVAAFLLDVIEDDEEVERRNQFRQLRLQRRNLRDTSNAFNIDPELFRKYYRMTQPVVSRLIDLLEDDLRRDRTSGIPPHLQVLITLRFLAEGALQKGVGQDFNHPVSQTTASRCITRVVDAINELADMFIKMPTTAAERQAVANRFQRTIRIPGIIGLVDGFLVKLRRPMENEEAFFNYREGHAMNVQIIVDSDYNIMNLRVCPGSNNDRFVWNYSGAKQFMENLRANPEITEEEGPYYILGDSGYTPSPVLLTPVLNAPEGSPAQAYTFEHVRTRCRVEQTIGVLSNVWMAVNRGRKLNYSPERVGYIINACAILHNFRRRHGMREEYEDIQLEVQDHEQRGWDYQAGIAERQRVINHYYVH